MALSKGVMLVDRYRIEGLLSKGGMGAVYYAFDTNLEIPVAIKENFFGQAESLAQFKREALILARLHHPGLPRVTDHFIEHGQQYLVMDFVAGLDLSQMMQQMGHPFTEQRAINIIVQICNTLTYLHNQSPPIIHRDIKPQNIKIRPNNRAVLVDFGLAKESTTQTALGAKAVTSGYSPPEQYIGGTSPASDIYALGCTLYTLLTGEIPPDSISLLTTSQRFVPANHINPQLSPQITDAIHWATQLKPEDRVQSAEEWKKRLLSISGPRHQRPTVILKDQRLVAPPPPQPAPVGRAPQSVLLTRGGNVPLKQVDPGLKQLAVKLGWQATSQAGGNLDLDLDGMAFMLTAQNQVRNDEDLIFYNNLKSSNGAVIHAGSTPVTQANEETIRVELSRVPQEIVTVIFAMSIYDAEARSQHFGMISAYIRLVNEVSGHEIVRYDLSGAANNETALILGKLYRHKGEWKFRAVGQGFKDGIAALVRYYGVDIG